MPQRELWNHSRSVFMRVAAFSVKLVSSMRSSDKNVRADLAANPKIPCGRQGDVHALDILHAQRLQLDISTVHKHAPCRGRHDRQLTSTTRLGVCLRKGMDRSTSTKVGAFHMGPFWLRCLSFSSRGLETPQCMAPSPQPQA